MPVVSPLSNFFDIYSMPGALEEMEQFFRYTSNTKVWKGGMPGNLLYLCEQLQALSDAVYRMDLYMEDALLQQPDKAQQPHWPIDSPALYYGKHVLYDAWDYFPRHLSRKQFLNPYKALQQYRQYQHQQAWRDSLHTLLEYALSNSYYDNQEHESHRASWSGCCTAWWKPAIW
jgi:hypothetical protein